ncbi:aminotransferase class-V domain-containing protein [Hirsutella rhossiliensis]|uniref:Aminotransferase class-V domain-containing protein n=1 Tax=Hirsutella rhossiliensis TaxID=111463 RepID=A0A9P8SLP2_9HYPO|nr:aminotransferase class-V domain-containing protein [Hirsutella rhossiliensis]KAH0967156.1 aminotransferase class-V domain-containing protein [Hirsutella rhossiliensis]
MLFSEEAIRAAFPALVQQQQQQGGQVLLDNAGGSQALGSVADSVRDYLAGARVQLGASYAASRACAARFAAAHDAAARFVNARAVDEVVFGPSATQLLRNLSQALDFRPGDELVVSAIDHEANVAPWLDLARRQDLVVRWWRPPPDTPDPHLRPEQLAALLSPRTRLVAFTHASNVLGTITDVRAVADEAHKVGALVCVDGVAFAPHRPVDVQALGVDMYVFSWYKVFGPHVATLYASWGAQAQLRSLGHFFNPSLTLADKLGLSAASYELCQAVTHVVDYLGPSPASDMWSAIVGHEYKLQSALLAALRDMPACTIYGVPQADPHLRVATVSFTVRDWDSKDFVEAVEKVSNYGFRWGAFYSSRLVRDTLRLGEHGVVRVSMVHYNTMDEVNGLIKVLERVVSR